MKLKKRLQAIGPKSITAFADMSVLKTVIKKSLISFVPLGIAIVGISGLVYLATQQNLRLTANDPQIQISEDITNAIAKGASPNSILPPSPNGDMARDLGPFVIIYKDSGDIVGSSTKLDNQIPKLPGGVLDLVKKTGEQRFTWEPKKGVRSAVVVRKYDGGMVLVGKSIREVGKREDLLLAQVGAFGSLVLVASFASKAILDGLVEKKR